MISNRTYQSKFSKNLKNYHCLRNGVFAPHQLA
nr:MAG TPA: hypothetical protein [Caudoviricetes sp.]